jgi:hypothetical protein
MTIVDDKQTEKFGRPLDANIRLVWFKFILVQQMDGQWTNTRIKAKIFLSVDRTHKN